MGININTPQVSALRTEVERKFGRITSHSGFVKLAEFIEQECKEHISITTLERIWNYSTRNADSVSVRILDIISRLTGAECWEAFCNTLKANAKKESELFASPDAINTSDLTKGTRIKIGWQPDRICEVEYIGENRFVAVYTENSSIRPGDSFSCLQIQKGRELYMDCFARSGEEVCNSTNRYVVGQISGITIIEIVEAAGLPVQE